MSIHDSMPTFSKVFHKSLQIWNSFLTKPYIAFLTACIVTTAIPPISLAINPSQTFFLTPFPFILNFIVLPVLFGNVALFLCSDKRSVFAPSLLIRFIYLAIVLIVYHQIVKDDWNPKSIPEYYVMTEVFFMSFFGAQCFVLLVSEPILRWMLREKVRNHGCIRTDLR